MNSKCEHLNTSAFNLNNNTEKKDAAKLNKHKLTEDLIKNDLKNLHLDIRNMFVTNRPELKEICDYYFDGSGKSIRPLIVCTLARVLNTHQYLKLNNLSDTSQIDANTRRSLLLASQHQIALITEMIHVASLMHDDIIDNSDLRRGKTSVNSQWGCHKAVLAGDYVLSVASRTLAQLGNVNAVEAFSTVLEDLVKGELMQFGTKENENERFEHYSTKTYRKTASLIANACKSVAHLLTENGGELQNKPSDKQADAELVSMAYECGKNVGIAFQLIDDVLDFTSHSDKLGKPGYGADLRLGLATAPVLFAAAQFPELNTMIMRRFSKENDVLKAFEFVLKSDGIKETRFLASKYCENAESILNKLKPTEEAEYLKYLIKSIIKREK